MIRQYENKTNRLTAANNMNIQIYPIFYVSMPLPYCLYHMINHENINAMHDYNLSGAYDHDR